MPKAALIPSSGNLFESESIRECERQKDCWSCNVVPWLRHSLERGNIVPQHPDMLSWARSGVFVPFACSRCPRLIGGML